VGAVRTEELTLPGFKHDTVLLGLSGAAASPVFARMPLAEHGLEWVHPAAAYAHPLPAARRNVLYRGLQDDRALDRPARRRRAGWSSCARSWTTSTRSRGDDARGFPPLGGPREAARPAPGRSACSTSPAHAARLRGRARQPPFDAGAAQAWLYGAAMHGDTPPDGAGSGIAAYLSEPARARRRLAIPRAAGAERSPSARLVLRVASAASCGRSARRSAS
jgi:phytoene dehydrogenase-like protein